MTYSRSRKKYARRNRLIAVIIFALLLGFIPGYAIGNLNTSASTSVPAQADALEVEPPPFVIHITNEEPETNAPNALETLEPERETFNLYEHIAMEMTSEEMRLLEIILACEAQDEPYDGQKAVVEVIFNRVLSPDFPDTVYDVLSQKGQFATWKWRNKPYNTPNQTQTNAIAEVIENGNQNTILPEDYVFFSVGKVNGTDFIKIGHHQFSRARKKS